MQIALDLRPYKIEKIVNCNDIASVDTSLIKPIKDKRNAVLSENILIMRVDSENIRVQFPDLAELSHVLELITNGQIKL